MGQFKKDSMVYVKQHDLVLIYINEVPRFYARVESISPDKPGWWTVLFTRLGIPLQKFTWTLDDDHMCCEAFTLNSVPHRMEIVPTEFPAEWELVKKKPEKVFRPGPKVINLFGPRPTYIPPFEDQGALI